MTAFDAAAIEEHKKMMKEQAIPLLESDSYPAFKFYEEHIDQGVLVTMVVEQDGQETLRTSEKVEMLNG